MTRDLARPCPAERGAGTPTLALAILLAALTPAGAQEAGALSPPLASAQDADPQTSSADAPPVLLSPVEVQASLQDAAVRRGLARLGLVSDDVAEVTQSIPGGSTWGAGGVSGLPAINGMGADRVQASIGGVITGPACANQMNPTLSYIAPAMIGEATAWSAAAPVSAGGDFSGGRIEIEPALPAFAPPPAPGEEGPAWIVSGSVSPFVRSNPGTVGLDGEITFAGVDQALTYRGSFVRASDYRAGDGTRILSTEYASQNHRLDYVRQGETDTLRLSAGIQTIPYQGFPSQLMDMTDNRSVQLSARFDRDADWGKLQLGGYLHHVRHSMNLLEDKLKWPSFDGTQAIMPMDTRATEMGLTAEVAIPLGEVDTLRLGAEAHHRRLEDWWDPIDPDPSAMMSPYPFEMINDGRRTRLGAFAEWERDWRPDLASTLGVRVDHVSMDAGPVHGYGSPDPTRDPQYGGDALVFDAQDRARDDFAVNAAASLRWEPTEGQSHELSLARRSRAPNLYERYAWSTNIMAMGMTGWFGDGNGYVGDVDLKPEVNNAVDLKLRWRDAQDDRWEILLNPNYAYVQDYIDVDRCSASAIPAVYTRCGHPDNATLRDDFVFLRFANHDAHLLGLNVMGRMRLVEDDDYGRFDLRLSASALRGIRTDGVDLYNIMPPNATVTLEHALGAWSGAVELRLVASKRLTSEVRNEVPTGGYGLINLRGSYEIGDLRIDAGIENLLDRRYALPTGGVNLTNGAAVVGQMASPVYGIPVLGPGRSFNLRMTLNF